MNIQLPCPVAVFIPSHIPIMYIGLDLYLMRAVILLLEGKKKKEGKQSLILIVAITSI